MPNDPILHLLGLARKAGRLEIGEEPVGAVCRAHQARLVLLAADAAPNTRRRAAHFGQAGNVLFLELPHTKNELGFLFGRGSCAMLALTDAGLAASLAEKLALRDPLRYGPAAEQLQQKADRMLQRQREKRQHEKNLREGKRKPWAAPPPPRDEDSTPPPRTPNKNTKPKSPAHGGPAPHSRAGADRPGHSPKKPALGGRHLTGKFRNNP